MSRRFQFSIAAIFLLVPAITYAEKTPAYVLKGSSGILQSLAFSPDGTLLLSSDGGITIWDVKSRKEHVTFEPRMGAASRSMFMPDGKRIVSSHGRGEVNLWNIETQERTMLLQDPNGSVGIALSTDGATLAVFSRLHDVQLWDVAKREKTSDIPLEKGAMGLFSTDGKRLFVADTKYVHAWDLPSKKQLWNFTSELKSKDAAISRIALSNDDKRLAIAYGGPPSTDCPINIHDPDSSAKLSSLAGHRGAIDSIAFAPDCDTLATGGEDRTIKLWSVKSREELEAFKGHGYQVTAVAFSPDGKLLASAGPDGTVRVWELGR